jgi:hypothetical protein
MFYTLSIVRSGELISLHLQTERGGSMTGPVLDIISVISVERSKFSISPFYLKMAKVLISETWFLAWGHVRYTKNQSTFSNTQSSEYFQAAFDTYEALHWRAQTIAEELEAGKPRWWDCEQWCRRNKINCGCEDSNLFITEN